MWARESWLSFETHFGQALLELLHMLFQVFLKIKVGHKASEWHEQEKSTGKAPVPSLAPWCAATNTEQEVDCRIAHGG